MPQDGVQQDEDAIGPPLITHQEDFDATLLTLLDGIDSEFQGIDPDFIAHLITLLEKLDRCFRMLKDMSMKYIER